MPVTCKKCGGPHPVWECRQKDAVAEVSPAPNNAPAADVRLEGGKRPTSPRRKATVAALETSAVPDGGSTKRGPGRPRIHADRKAYKAEKERQRRLRLKATQIKTRQP